MARHHTALDRLLDLKPHALALCDATIGRSPGLRMLSGFFPDFGWPGPDATRVISDESRRHNLYLPRHAQALATVSQHNVDVMNPLETACAAEVSRTMIAEIADVVIPGHTITPAQIATGRQIALGQQGKARWSFCYPAPVFLKRITVDQPCIAIPPFFHYTHLLTDVLMPICEAIRMGAIGRDEEIVVVTGAHPPLVAAFLDGMRGIGLRMRHIMLKPTQHVVAKRYIYAKSHCPNIEWIFGVPQALETMHAIFAAAYRGRPVTRTASRVYMKRSGHRQRIVAGEEEMIGHLEKAGFKVFEPAWSNHHEQIALSAGADVIAAVHGAALVNVLFCRPGARIVELMAFDARKTVALHWASQSGADLVPVLGGPEGARQSFAIDPRSTADAIIQAAHDVRAA